MAAKMDERIDRLETEVSNLKSDVKVNTIFIKDAKKILMGIFITVIVTLASTIIANTLSHDSLEKSFDQKFEQLIEKINKNKLK